MSFPRVQVSNIWQKVKDENNHETNNWYFVPLFLSQEYRWWCGRWSWWWRQIDDESKNDDDFAFVFQHGCTAVTLNGGWKWMEVDEMDDWRNVHYKTKSVKIEHFYLQHGCTAVTLNGGWNEWLLKCYLRCMIVLKFTNCFCSTVAQQSPSMDGQESSSQEELMATSSILQGGIYYNNNMQE